MNVRGDEEAQSDLFPFVPEEVYGVLYSLYATAKELHTALRMEWVSKWDGWTDARTALAVVSGDVDKEFEVAAEFGQRFARRVLDDAAQHLRLGKSDSLRKAELRAEGYDVGVGRVHGSNE